MIVSYNHHHIYLQLHCTHSTSRMAECRLPSCNALRALPSTVCRTCFHHAVLFSLGATGCSSGASSLVYAPLRFFFCVCGDQVPRTAYCTRRENRITLAICFRCPASTYHKARIKTITSSCTLDSSRKHHSRMVLS